MANRGPVCHKGGITAEGPADADLMIVSIGPGYQELREKRPFVGESGQLLAAILKAVGYTRDQTYLSNVCCDHLGEEEADAARCFDRLKIEINEVKPKLIVPLGAWPTEMLTATWDTVPVTVDASSDVWPVGQATYLVPGIVKPGKTIGKVRGQPLWYDNVYNSGHSCRIMPTWQPAAALREGGAGYLQDIIRDLSKLCAPPIGVSLLEWGRNHAPFKWYLADNEARLAELLSHLDAAFPVAIDIETGNSENIEEMTMDVYREKLLCFALGQTQTESTFSFTVTPECYPAFVKWFEYYGAEFKWLTHYGFFDVQGIRELLGIKVQIARDSLSGSHCLDERPGLHKLKVASREYLGCDPWESFIEDDLAQVRAIDKFMSRLKPQDVWIKGMEPEDPELLFACLDKNGRVDKDLASEDQLALWELFKKNWHHNRRTMDEPTLEAFDLRELEIEGYGFEKLDPGKLYKYNGEDAARTAQLDALQKPMLADEGLTDYYRAISIPDLNVNADIAYEGIPIDLNVRDQLKESWQPIADRMEQDLQERARELGYENEDGTPINLASWKQKGTLFYDVMKLQLPNVKGARTKSGAPSTNIKVIQEIQDDSGFIDKMIAWSHANHQLGAYIDPMPSFVRNYVPALNFGVNHPVYKPHATRTNRGAYSAPPWHQFPKYVAFDSEPEFEGDDPFHAGKEALRRMVVPWLAKDLTIDKEHYIFVEADLKSAEQYANAYLSGDEEYLKDIKSGDTHEAAARRLYHLDRETWPDWSLVPENGKKRREGKTVNFGVAYGIQEHSLAMLLKVSDREAAVMLDTWWSAYNKYQAKTKEWKFEALKTGRLVSPSGRVRHFGLIKGEDSFHELNQAMNFPGQNTVTDSMKMSKMQLHQGSQARHDAGADYLYTDGLFDSPPLAEYDSRILFDIHDMLAFMVRIDHFQEVMWLISEVMSQGYFGLPGIPVDIAAGPTWGDTESVENIDGIWTLTGKH